MPGSSGFYQASHRRRHGVGIGQPLTTDALSLQAGALSTSKLFVTDVAEASEVGRGWTIHALDRAFERFGIDPAPRYWRQALLDIIEAAARIGLPRAILLRRETEVEYWCCAINGCQVVAVYRPDHACIITVTPLTGRAKRDDHRHYNRRTPRRKDKADRYRPRWGDDDE